jgi:hypothetical protein
MRRKVWKKNDPVVDKNNEPDLYAVSRDHPLPNPILSGMDERSLGMMQHLGGGGGMGGGIPSLARNSPLFGMSHQHAAGMMGHNPMAGMGHSSMAGMGHNSMAGMGHNSMAGMNDVMCGQVPQTQRSLDSLLYFNALDTYRPPSMSSLNQLQASQQLQANKLQSQHRQMQANQLQATQFAARASQLRSSQQQMNSAQDPAIMSLLYSGYGADDSSLSAGNQMGAGAYPGQTNSLSTRSAELRRLLSMRAPNNDQLYFPQDENELKSPKKSYGARIG